jgi:hypothetical protein
MEQPALLNINRADTIYRFRLDLPEGLKDLTFAGQEYITDLNAELGAVAACFAIGGAIYAKHGTCGGEATNH